MRMDRFACPGFCGAENAITALVADRDGSSFVQTLILVAAVSLGSVGAFQTLRSRIDDKVDCAGEAIFNLTPLAALCGAGVGGESPPTPEAPVGAQGAAPSDPEPGDAPVEGPALVQAGPIVALPFPGSIAVTCTAFKGQETPNCKDDTGVRVQASGEVALERTPTRLDFNGCPKQDLQVSGKLQVELSGKAKGQTLGGTLALIAGAATKFKVTVSPEAADAIARGERPSPNPIDPTSIGVGEIVELSEEFFTGLKLQGTYRALQAELGFEQGRRLSSGVRRIDERTVRIFVGDSEFVREALALGATGGEFGISIGGKAELASGDLRAVDIDIGTAAGFEAYQRFLAEGKLPPPGAPGTKDPVTAETLDFSDTTKVEAKLGRVKLGGVLGDSEGHILETRHADGTLDTIVSARFNDVGLVARRTEAPDGTTTSKNFSLLIEGADRNSIATFEQATGTSLAASPDGNVRLDFTEADLRALQEQALDQILQRARDNGNNISREDLARALREDRKRLETEGLNDSLNFAFEIAGAGSPEEVLEFLYLSGGPSGNGTIAIENLLNFARQTARARNGLREFPKDHPESRLPGAAFVPDCK